MGIGGDLPTDFVAAADDVDRVAKAGGGRGLAQQADDGLAGLQPHSLARARDVGKAAAFARVELWAIARERLLLRPQPPGRNTDSKPDRRRR